ncbi:hypothetical protein BX600DRAFT_518256 [Xylariales sp. PMI_506]|nr:hypothetical protein BX600DRAFT_518256 [Xylariales sp. PMI_506]
MDPVTDVWRTEDAWRGVTSTLERKKRQNRINQRAWRRRHKPAKQSQWRRLEEEPVPHRGSAAHSGSAAPSQCLTVAAAALDSAVMFALPHQIARARERIQQAYEDYLIGTSRRTSLPVLIRINVLEALARNALLMGFQLERLCSHIYTSPFNHEGPVLPRRPVDSTMPPCPSSLMPTNMQRRVRHHTWVDLFPFPQFRDNIIRALEAGVVAEDEVCLELLDTEAQGLDHRPALMIWGNSWDDHGWEANVHFLRKWGWLIRGCPEIMESTNYWRQRRGERALVYEHYSENSERQSS